MNPQVLVMMLKSAAIAQNWARVSEVVEIIEHLTGRVMLPLDGDRVTALVNGTLARIENDAAYLRANGMLPGQGCGDPECEGCGIAPPDHPAPDLEPSDPPVVHEPAEAVSATLRDDEPMADAGPFVMQFQNGTSVTLDNAPITPFVLWTEIPGEQ